MMAVMIKTKEELNGFRLAAKIGEKAVQAGLDTARTGGCDVEKVKNAVQTSCREFEITMLASLNIHAGKSVNIEEPPSESDYVLQKGDMVSIQLAGVHQGFVFELFRVTTVGDPSNEKQDFLDHLIEAADWMAAVLKAGKPVKFYYTESRGRYIFPAFHGIEIDLKEEPVIGINQQFEPEAGMLLIVKPEIVDPQFGRMCHSAMIEI